MCTYQYTQRLCDIGNPKICDARCFCKAVKMSRIDCTAINPFMLHFPFFFAFHEFFIPEIWFELGLQTNLLNGMQNRNFLCKHHVHIWNHINKTKKGHKNTINNPYDTLSISEMIFWKTFFLKMAKNTWSSCPVLLCDRFRLIQFKSQPIPMKCQLTHYWTIVPSLSLVISINS